MNKLVYFLFSTILLLNLTGAWAGLALQVEMTHKKGIDKGLILTSEMHAIEDLTARNEVTLRMKNGIAIQLQVGLIQLYQDYGPSASVVVTADIFDQDGNKVKTINDAKLIINLGEDRLFTYQDQAQDQMLEIRVKPFIR